MARPGVEVTNRAEVPSRGPATDTGQWFVVGETLTGVGEVHEVNNLEDFDTEFGGRTAGGLRDAVETFFREGGGKAIVSSPTPTGVGPSVVDADRIAALAKFVKSMGPGQVSVPGITTQGIHTALLDHSAANNRRALLDAPDSADEAVLIAAAAAQRGTVNAGLGAMWGPPVEIPGLVPGTTREVPYSALQAGLIARSDRSNLTNTPAAGANGEAQFVLGVKHAWTDAEREALNDAGVNIGKDVYGGTRTYGYRTLVDPAGPDFPWLSFANSRLQMQITAEAEAIGESFMFAQIDGRRQKIAEFAGALTGMLSRYYDGGALFGETPDDAFLVDVGPTVNTVDSLAANELRAVLGVRMSPFAELVTIEIVKVPITESL